MWLSLFIAKRYLFSKKKQNAINIISTISVVGVTIGTAALIIILSVFNGIDVLLQKSTNSFYPDVVISPTNGKTITYDSLKCAQINNINGVDYFYSVIQEKTIVKHQDSYLPVILKGIDSKYVLNSDFNQYIRGGIPKLKDNDKFCVLIGNTAAIELGIYNISNSSPITFYYPNKNSSNALNALTTRTAKLSAVYSVQQEIDAQYIICDIEFAKSLFKLDNKISKIEIKLKSDKYIDSAKEEINRIFNNAPTKDKSITTYKIQDKFEINQAFFAMMRSEKFAVFMILLFILLIASFNIIGSISMLIIDKKEDLVTYKAMGMPKETIASIFTTEGKLITIIGTIIGTVLGVAVCFIQEHYGLLTLGEGGYIVNAYPVKLILSDIMIIVATVLAIGYIASIIPVKYLINKLTKQ